MTKRQKKRAKRRKAKVCNRCGCESPLNAQKCKKCESTRFAPSWVLAKRSVNRQVAVEITNSNPQYGKVQKRITLTKWWPGANATFHIPNVAQWTTIEDIINNDLGPIVGWKTKKQLVQTVEKKKKEAREVTKDIQQLVKDYPDFLTQVLEAVKAAKLGKDDLEALVGVLGQLAETMANADAGFKQAFLSIVNTLPKQGKRALEDLELILQQWSLHQVTSVAQQVKMRLETIELFKKQIRDERTFEITGDNSIHRILERAMWLIDERYWLLQSNATLRTLIGDAMAKKDKKRYGKKRPDFVCGMVSGKLILIELKRPSHKLTIEDLNQLETYLTVAEEYSSHRSYEAYLIGNKKDPDLMRRLKHRSSNFKVRTYSDLIADTENRYQEFLRSLAL